MSPAPSVALRRSLLVPAAAWVLLAGCGGADRGAIEQNLALARAAYVEYIDTPTTSGQIGPGTATTAPARQRAASAAQYAVATLTRAKGEATKDPDLSSLAVKISATTATITDVARTLQSGLTGREVVASGRATLENLLATARDRGLDLPDVTVTADDLTHPPD